MRRAKIFVENFFGTLGDEPLEFAYLNFLRDIQLHSPTNRAIRDNSTYLCYIFSKITHTNIEELVQIESKYKGPPLVIPLDKELLEELLTKDQPTEHLEKPIYAYTAEDAVRDGIFVRIGSLGKMPMYMTSNLFGEGYEDRSKLESLVRRGIEFLSKPDKEDTYYLHLRVIEENRIWVTLTVEGITFMNPSDY